MPKKDSTLVNLLLIAAYSAGGILSLLMVSPYERARRLLYGNHSYRSYRNSVSGLQRRGLINIFEKNGRKFLSLTQKGELEVLLAKARMPKSGKWDKKWRLIIFDIPEATKLQRDQLRSLLKKNDFAKLQASVYISPYPLNREAVEYLERTGLMEFIRILKVEEMDNDAALRKKFKLI